MGRLFSRNPFLSFGLFGQKRPISSSLTKIEVGWRKGWQDILDLSMPEFGSSGRMARMLRH
jgi:hypothetical protein